MTMTRDEARVLISSLIEWYTEDIAERLGLSMGKETYMDALEVLWHGPEGELISRADAIEAVHKYFVKEIDKTPHEIDEDGFDVYTDMPTVNSLLACNKELSKELKALPSADMKSWNGLYIKVYDDDDPQDKAEKLYQICDSDETLAEVAKCIQGYLDEPSAEAVDVTHDIPEYCSWSQTYTNMVQGAMSKESAEAVQGWILCSERLPSADDCPMDCMVTRRSKYVGNYTDMAVAEADGTWTHEDWKAITIRGEATCISTMDADIIAWMPLPKPYKGGDDE